MELTKLKYVSEKRAKDFKKLNIENVEQLIKHFPRDYLDMTHVTPLMYAYHNDSVLTVAEVLNVTVNKYSSRPFVKALCQQNGYMFNAVWFFQPYVAAKLKRGEYLFYGRVQNKDGMGCTLYNPTFEEADKARRLKGLIPVYPLSAGLGQGIVRSAILQGISLLPPQSAIPHKLIEKYSLISLEEAYKKVHSPQNKDDVKIGSERIALEEYFLLISAFKVIRGGRDEARINRYKASEQDLKKFIGRFPFEFTEGQNNAVKAIYSCLKGPHKMNMLLQGDVGSGKTAVALAGIYMAVNSGYQAAMLAPTEVLAQQNAQLLGKFFPDYNVCLLAGSVPAEQKRRIKAGLKSGEIDIVCGTHAVLQDDVAFKNLAFVVCDEQHRFGVAQRASLSDKGVGCDVLVMSATPIPRTLSLIFYGDLDITTILDKPRSRREIATSIIPAEKYDDMYNYISRQAALGNQTYLVCPKIEGDEEGTVMSVTELFNDLKTKLRGVKLGLLHGKMKDKQKNEVMSDFKSKKYDCLVTTTVIEVGVDVPDATVMVIYNAERFGLSQLHQLRGRVGRGDKKSYCFLLIGSDSELARERLNVIKDNTDGFKIAEADLKLRGSGDFMGTRQSGKVLSEIKNLKFPVETVFTAKAISDEAFSGDFDICLLSRIACEKYNNLKDVILN